MFCYTESVYNVETKTIAVDFSQLDIYPKIDSALAGLEIGVLGESLFVCNFMLLLCEGFQN